MTRLTTETEQDLTDSARFFTVNLLSGFMNKVLPANHKSNADTGNANLQLLNKFVANLLTYLRAFCLLDTYSTNIAHEIKKWLPSESGKPRKNSLFNSLI